MTTAVYKYPIELGDAFTLTMPQGAESLCVQVQHGQPCLWARVVVDVGHPTKSRRFRLAGTGHPLEPRMPDGHDGDYVGTVQMNGGSLVLHVFDCGEE